MTQTCRDAVHVGYNALKNASHAGLLLSSYLQSDTDESRSGLLKLARRATGMAREVYEKAFTFFKKYLPVDTVSELVEVDGRAVVGLGIESPLETGLALHHTYGVPYIPGSALKGLAAHYCDQVWGETEQKFRAGGDYHQVLFGTTDDGGYIVFNDAWITPESLDQCLDLDVMAVHHPQYYRGDDSAPSDFDDPDPITFLSVKGRFWLSLRADIAGDAGKAWAHLAMNLLLEALENWGIGAKTNAGYGRMRKVELMAQRSISTGNERHNAGPVSPPSQAQPRGLSQWKAPCKAGDRVSATMSDEKTKTGKWKAIYRAAGKQWIGPIRNSEAVPASVKPGDTVELVIGYINRTDIAFDWPK